MTSNKILLPQNTRPLLEAEIKLLKKIKRQAEKELDEEVRYHYFILAAFIGLITWYLASITSAGILVFLFGTASVFAFFFIIFMPYEIYKDRRRNQKTLDATKALLEEQQITTWPIQAQRIAIAKEYDDEGELFLIELDQKKVLYLWNHHYNLKRKFPCLEFEIYPKDYTLLTNQLLLPISPKISPLTIDKKAKWAYLKKYGTPGHMEVIKKNLDQVIEKFLTFS